MAENTQHLTVGRAQAEIIIRGITSEINRADAGAASPLSWSHVSSESLGTATFGVFCDEGTGTAAPVLSLAYRTEGKGPVDTPVGGRPSAEGNAAAPAESSPTPHGEADTAAAGAAGKSFGDIFGDIFGEMVRARTDADPQLTRAEAEDAVLEDISTFIWQAAVKRLPEHFFEYRAAPDPAENPYYRTYLDTVTALPDPENHMIATVMPGKGIGSVAPPVKSYRVMFPREFDDRFACDPGFAVYWSTPRSTAPDTP